MTDKARYSTVWTASAQFNVPSPVPALAGLRAESHLLMPLCGRAPLQEGHWKDLAQTGGLVEQGGERGMGGGKAHLGVGRQEQD